MSLDLRDSGGDPDNVDSSFIFDFSLSLSLVLSLFFPKPNILNAGAFGLSFGVEGRFWFCEDDVGRVPIGACRGRLSRFGGSMNSISSSGRCKERLVVELYPTDGRLECDRDIPDAQSGTNGLFRAPPVRQTRNGSSMEDLGIPTSKEYVDPGRGDELPPLPPGSME